MNKVQLDKALPETTLDNKVQLNDLKEILLLAQLNYMHANRQRPNEFFKTYYQEARGRYNLINSEQMF